MLRDNTRQSAIKKPGCPAQDEELECTMTRYAKPNDVMRPGEFAGTGIHLGDSGTDRMVRNAGWITRELLNGCNKYNRQASPARARSAVYIAMDRSWCSQASLLTGISFRPSNCQGRNRGTCRGLCQLACLHRQKRGSSLSAAGRLQRPVGTGHVFSFRTSQRAPGKQALFRSRSEWRSLPSRQSHPKIQPLP
jgi:hypothetical protein